VDVLLRAHGVDPALLKAAVHEHKDASPRQKALAELYERVGDWYANVLLPHMIQQIADEMRRGG